MEKEIKYSEKKAYEIAYALFRIAEIVKNKSIAEYLEGGALRHLRAVILLDSSVLAEVGRELEFYLRIGQDLNFIHPENAQAIIAELRGLSAHIAEISGKAKMPEVLRLGFTGKDVNPIRGGETLQDIKVSLDNINKQIEILSESEQATDVDLIESVDSGEDVKKANFGKVGLKIEKQTPVIIPIEASSGEDSKLNIFNGETRQMAIYELIRQFGKEFGNGCRMRDLQESFSGVSERTIRYDLEKLMEMGLIERAGQSGPGTYYKVKKLTPSLV